MNYISKKIEKKIFINYFNLFFFILKKNKFFLFYDIFVIYFNKNEIFFLKNFIFILKKYFKESGFIYKI
jgi:hypothetical protein